MTLATGLALLVATSSVAVNPLPTARTGVAPFAVSYGNRSSQADMYAPRYQVMTSNFSQNVSAMHAANPTLPLLGYIEPNMQEYDLWCATAQRLETLFQHNADAASLTALPASGAVRLVWLPDGRAALGHLDCLGYNVYRRAATDSAFAPLTPSPIQNTTFTDAGVADGVAYDYMIVSVDRTQGEETYSGVVTVSAGPSSVPALAPGSVTVTPATNTISISITVSAAPSLSGVDLVLDADHSLTFQPGERIAMVRGGQDAFGLTLYSAVVTLDEAPLPWRGSGCSWYVEAAAGNPSVRLPATGYFTTHANNRLKSRTWGCWIMNPGDPAWQAILSDGARGLMAEGYDGIFIDVGVTTIAEWWPDTIASDAAAAGWKTNTRSLMAAIKAAVTPGSVIFNGLSRQALDYLDVTDGAMVEGFIVSTWDTNIWSREFAWTDMLNVALEAASRGATQLNYAVSPETDVRQRLFSLASHLLIADGHAFYTYDGGCNCPVYYPEWDLPLGTPLQSFTDIAEARRPSGLYARRMSGGLVLVNANDTETFTEVLDAPMALVVPTGGTIPAYGGNGTMRAQWVTRVTLAPQEGAILLADWSGDVLAPQRPSVTLTPNPAGRQVTLSIEQALGGRVQVFLYDVRGRRIARILDTTLPPGASTQPLDLTPFGLRPGVYALVAETPAGRTSRSIVLAP